ncbi:MAG: hypothetical protein L3J93_02885 [Thermoplasmata archaeon]|nr:hypothetical protein [Thermoplasmata archaeon]
MPADALVPRFRLLAFVLLVAVLLAIPPLAGLPVRGLANAAAPRGPAHASLSLPNVGSATSSTISPPQSTLPSSIQAPLSRATGTSMFKPIGGAAAPPSHSATPAPPAAAKTVPYEWSSAFVGYSPTDPASLLFGEGTGVASDNARDETVWFGGLATGGLSNVTFEYWWYFNRTNIFNSSEVVNYTSSPTSPSARTNLSFATYQAGGVALLFGGLTNLRTQATANDTWLFNFTRDRWTNVTVPGGPPPREEAAFAVDQKDGIALLFGGIAPSFTSHGSNGSVIWRDTWEFSFATNRWTELFPVVVPSGRFGASMVWDAGNDQFLLVGGCAFSCTMDAWAFKPGATNWTPIAETGQIPPPRAGASFAWDPGSGNAVLYGGMSFDASGNIVVYGDSYRFLPSGAWSSITPSAPGPAPLYKPPPLFDAATTWTNFNDCNVMWVVGGNPSLTGIPQLVYVIQPTNDTPFFQCWWWWQEPAPPPQPPPPCSHISELVVSVESSADRSPISGAIVSIRGQCLPSIGWTGPDGAVQFTIPTPDNLSLNVSANNFHGNLTWYNYTYTNTSSNTSGTLVRYLLVFLVPFPRVNVQVLGDNGGIFLTPVPYAAVALYNSSVIAVTDLHGWGNSSAVSAFNRTAPVSASADNYSSNWKTIKIPYTGVVNTTIIILKAGTLTVKVLDLRTGKPIVRAFGTVTRLDPGLPAPFRFSTDSDGLFSRQVPLGNYSASAGAFGYLPNASGGRAYIPWVHNATITIHLLLDYGTNASVRLVDARTGSPISPGLVTYGEARPVPTNGRGWGNGTNLGPPGPAKIIGSADGYAPNSTLVVFGFDTTLAPITLRLTPLCPGAACPPITGYGGNGISPLLPAGGAALVILLLAPAILVVAGAFYAFGNAARRSQQTAAFRSGILGRADQGERAEFSPTEA